MQGCLVPSNGRRHQQLTAKHAVPASRKGRAGFKTCLSSRRGRIPAAGCPQGPLPLPPPHPVLRRARPSRGGAGQPPPAAGGGSDPGSGSPRRPPAGRAGKGAEPAEAGVRRPGCPRRPLPVAPLPPPAPTGPAGLRRCPPRGGARPPRGGGGSAGAEPLPSRERVARAGGPGGVPAAARGAQAAAAQRGGTARPRYRACCGGRLTLLGLCVFFNNWPIRCLS